MKLSKYIKVSYIIVLLTVVSCKKFVTVDSPANRIDQGNVYSDDATATSVLNSIYTQMSAVGTSSTSGFLTLTKYLGLSADEFGLWTGASDTYRSYYENALYAAPQSSPGSELWGTMYPPIVTCNAAIDGISSSTTLSNNVKQQLLGEAKFLRALFYFYLVNLYGDVPLVTGTDYNVNRVLSRTQVSTVYQFIIDELKQSQDLLSNNFLDSKLKPYSTTPERVRPTKWAATALLSRVYLFTGQYSNSEIEASAIINNTSLFDTVSVNDVFLKNSKEAIWQLQPVIPNTNSVDGSQFVLTASPAGFSSNKPFYLNPALIASIEANDKRRANWIGTYTTGSTTYFFPYKYKAGTTISTPIEYSMVLRLAEIYLIRAEARAFLGNSIGSNADINIIRKRAGLSANNYSDQQALLSAIAQERRIELFAELGHRWLDLKRTKAVDTVMSVYTPLKTNGSNWKSYQQLYPIPYTDLQRNPNLIQNIGY